MEKLTTPHTFLALEDFYLQNQNATTNFLDWRSANAAWALKDMSPNSHETEELCQRLQTKIRDRVGNRPAHWVMDVEESHVILDVRAWVEDSLKKAIATRPASCGWGDLDLNVETQWNCGVQLEEFHTGTWAKDKLTHLFSCENFESLEPLESRFEQPLQFLVDRLDRDLQLAVAPGMKHPHTCSVGIGALSLRLLPHEGKPEETIPLVRRVRVSDIKKVLESVKYEIDEFNYKGLANAIQEQQANLRCLPDGWPNEEVSALMKEWAVKRFHGDAGLMGSDLFEGNWIITDMPSDARRQVQTANAVEETPKSLGQLRREQAERDEADLVGVTVEELRFSKSFIRPSEPKKDNTIKVVASSPVPELAGLGSSIREKAKVLRTAKAKSEEKAKLSKAPKAN